MRKKESTVESE